VWSHGNVDVPHDCTGTVRNCFKHLFHFFGVGNGYLSGMQILQSIQPQGRTQRSNGRLTTSVILKGPRIMENIDSNYRLRGPRSPFGTKDQAAHYRTVRCQRKVNRGDQKIQTHQSLHQNFIVQKVSNTSMYLIMINALCNGCACSAVNRLEKETGKRTFPQRRFRSPMKGFDSYDFWPYNVPRK
jgi:hypothetical protein